MKNLEPSRLYEDNPFGGDENNPFCGDQHPVFDKYDYYRVQTSYQGESLYGFLDKGIEFPALIEADYPFIVSLGEEASAEIFAEFGDNAPLVFTSDDY